MFCSWLSTFAYVLSSAWNVLPQTIAWVSLSVDLVSPYPGASLQSYGPAYLKLLPIKYYWSAPSPVLTFYHTYHLLEVCVCCVHQQPYLHAKKLDCHNLMDAGRRHTSESPGDEMVDVISHATASSRTLSLSHFTWILKSLRSNVLGARYRM